MTPFRHMSGQSPCYFQPFWVISQGCNPRVFCKTLRLIDEITAQVIEAPGVVSVVLTLEVLVIVRLLLVTLVLVRLVLVVIDELPGDPFAPGVSDICGGAAYVETLLGASVSVRLLANQEWIQKSTNGIAPFGKWQNWFTLSTTPPPPSQAWASAWPSHPNRSRTFGGGQGRRIGGWAPRARTTLPAEKKSWAWCSKCSWTSMSWRWRCWLQCRCR